MTTAVIVQARMGSSRLPGKVALDLGGAPLLTRMLERVRAAESRFELVVATTTDAEDDPVVRIAERAGATVYRGHPTDLLDRHLGAASSVNASVVAKIPSDCPLIDPRVIDRAFALWNSARFDYVSNLHPATYPDGNDVEIMSVESLRAAHAEAQKAFEREHTTPFLWERPERFRLGNLAWETGRDLSMSHRFTIDYEDDYRFIAAVWRALHREGSPPFSVDDVVSLTEREPAILALNARYAGVNWYRHHLDELQTVAATMTKQSPQGSP